MSKFKIVWEMEVEADTHQQAANLAYEVNIEDADATYTVTNIDDGMFGTFEGGVYDEICDDDDDDDDDDGGEDDGYQCYCGECYKCTKDLEKSLDD